MVLVLCIGDFHVPHRATQLPQRFKELLQPGKIHHILCTGNLCCRVDTEIVEYLRTVCGSIHYVKGDFDIIQGPEDKVITIEDFKIGLCHGHQVVPAGDVDALGILMRRLDVDILLTGHTHVFQVLRVSKQLDRSATGAYSVHTDDVIPSFMLMDITGNKVDVYIYQMIDGESKVKKMEFAKPASRSFAKAPKDKFKSAVNKVMDSAENETEQETKESSQEGSNGNPPAHE